MRFSIANLLLVMLVVGLGIAWSIDRNHMQKAYENRIETLESSIRVYDRKRLLGDPPFPRLSQETQLRELTDLRDEQAEIILRILAIFAERDSIENTSLVNIFTYSSMIRLGCCSVSELQAIVRESRINPSIIVDPSHPEHSQFANFIELAMSDPYSWEYDTD